MHLPHRAGRDRRRDGRVRLRSGLRTRLRDRRGRLLLHERVRWVSRPGCCRGSSCASSRVVCTPMCCTPASWAWRWVWWCRAERRAAAPSRRRSRRAVCTGGRSATSCGTRHCWICSPRTPGPEATGSWSRSRRRSKGLPLLVFVSLAVFLARRRERRWLHDALRGEVGLDGISGAELEVLASPSKRRAARRAMRTRAGSKAGSLLHRLQREQVNLAMVASRVSTREIRPSCDSAPTAVRCAMPSAPCRGRRRLHPTRWSAGLARFRDTVARYREDIGMGDIG